MAAETASYARGVEKGSMKTPKIEAANSDGSMLLSMDDFKAFRQIGKGKDCVVYSATCDKLNGASVVLKVYDKAKISAIKHRSVRREARIMRYLTEKGVPHTTAYTGAFQDSKQIYIVMEHCSGGDLLEQLLREGRAMAERRVVREVVLPSLTALAYLHAAGVIHRDIKLENLFISSSGHLQLGDFGLAISTQEERAISPVGTLEYMPPEILRLPSTDLVVKGLVSVDDITPVDEKVDVWSFGVTVYELVTGRSPFEGASKDEIKAAILGYKMRPLPTFLTPGCQDFVLQAMCPRAQDRPGAMQLLNHPWVQLHCTPGDLVAVARLPLQLPRVPMGHRSAPPKHRSRAAGAAAATAAPGAVTADGVQQQSPVSQAAQAIEQQQQQQQQQAGLAAKVKCGGMPSSPSSPQIPAFMPGASINSGSSCATGMAGIRSSGSGSSCSNATSMADSAASLYQPPAGMTEQGWAVAGKQLQQQQQQQQQQLHSHGRRSPQEPIYEQSGEESSELQHHHRQHQQQWQQQQQQGGEEMVSPRSRKHGGNMLLKWMCMSPTGQEGAN
ncbi:kinase-like domain-containing protein [Scenedesmus sp. NREL 46B-D3]|nr:kinase-like domain-containing protein [Scenedesmus sp. NREL 46B-D3]